MKCSSIVAVRPGVEHSTDELGAIVGHEHRGFAPGLDEPLEHLRDAPPAQRSIDFDRQAGAGEVVDHGEDAKAPAVVEDIEHEIEGPSLVHARRRREPRDPAWYPPST